MRDQKADLDSGGRASVDQQLFEAISHRGTIVAYLKRSTLGQTPSMPYVLLWVKLEPVSFANLTREEEPESSAWRRHSAL